MASEGDNMVIEWKSELSGIVFVKVQDLGFADDSLVNIGESGNFGSEKCIEKSKQGRDFQLLSLLLRKVVTHRKEVWRPP